jgi:hypothetical protein
VRADYSEDEGQLSPRVTTVKRMLMTNIVLQFISSQD